MENTDKKKIRLTLLDNTQRDISHDIENEDPIVLGRGANWDEITDKRISRKHCQILADLNSGTLCLEPLHTNPCFNTSDENSPTLINKSEKIVLHHGDKFSLLPGKLQYLVDVVKVEQQTDDSQLTATTVGSDNDEENVITPQEEQPCASSTSTKRVLPSWMDASNDEGETSPKPKKKMVKKSKIANKPSGTVVDMKPHVESDKPDIGHSSNDELAQPINASINTASSSVVASAAPTATDITAVNPVPTGRPRCQYAEKCFRKNPQHLQAFAHPSDPDWNNGSGDGASNPSNSSQTATNDNLPVCPYGLNCYRKNSQHRLEMSHPISGNRARNTDNVYADDDDSDDFSDDDDSDGMDE